MGAIAPCEENMLELILTLVFFGASASAAAMIWRKIPLLAQVPNQLIQQSFVTRPSRLKQFIDPVAAFLRDGKYRDLYYIVSIKLLTVIRVWLLRLERRTFQALERMQNKSRQWSETKDGYLSELSQWKQEARDSGGANIPKAVFHPEAPPDVATKKSRRRKVTAKTELPPAV